MDDGDERAHPTRRSHRGNRRADHRHHEPVLPTARAIGDGFGNARAGSCSTPSPLSSSGSEAVISWADTDAILEQSTNVTGPWSEVADATSPHIITPVTGQKFYRLRRS